MKIFSVSSASITRPRWKNAVRCETRAGAVVGAAGEVCKRRAVEDRLVVHHPDSGHDFSDAMRQAAYAWLDSVLGHQ